MLMAFLAIQGTSYFGILSKVESYWLRNSILEILMFIPIVVFLAGDKNQFVPMMRVKPVKIRVLLLAVVVEMCMTPVIWLCNLVTELFTPNVVEIGVGSYVDETPYFLMILSMAVIPAIVEEVSVRGIIQSAFSRSGRKFAAILMSSVCFGIMHGNVNQFVYAFIMGIAFGFVVEATDSVIPVAVMHFFTNWFALTLLYYVRYVTIAQGQLKGVLELIGGKVASPEIEAVQQNSQLMDVVSTASEVIAVVMNVLFAVAGVFAAYKLICRIAVITGRTGHMLSIIPEFIKKRVIKNPGGMQAEKAAAVSDLPCTRIMNPVLAIGILIWVGVIVLYECIVHGVIA